MKHLIKIESTPHGVLGVRHAGLDQQYCEAGEIVILEWQPDTKWGLQEAHYTDKDGNIVPIDLGNGKGVVAFMMPDKNITVGGTFKMFVSQDWTEGTNPSKGEVLTVGNNGEPTPISVDELANEIAEGDNNLVDSIDDINPFKGWYANLATLQASHPSPQVGDYAYVKGAESTDPAAIYECTTAGSWSDSGRTVDTSNVQTFASSQEVNEVHIVNDLTTGGVDNVLSAEQGVVLDGRVSQLEVKVDELDIATEKKSVAIITRSGYMSKTQIDENGTLVTLSNQYLCYFPVIANVDYRIKMGFGNMRPSRCAFSVTIPELGDTITLIDTNTDAAYKYKNYIPVSNGYICITAYTSSDRDSVNISRYDSHFPSLELSVSDALGAIGFSQLASGYYNLINQTVPDNPNSSNSWKNIVLNTLPGAKYRITTMGGNTARAYAIADKESNILSVAEAIQNTLQTYDVTIPENGSALYINCDVSASNDFKVNLTNGVTGLVELIDQPNGVEEPIARSYINPFFPYGKKKLKALVIGNSYTNNSLTYIDGLIQASGIDTTEMCIYALSGSGYSIDSWISEIENNTTLTLTKYAGDLTMQSGTMQTILAQDWDVILITQASSKAYSWVNFSNVKKYVGLLMRYCTNQSCCIIYQMPWSHRGESVNDEGLVSCTKKLASIIGIDIINPSGMAVKNARNTTLENEYDLTSDGTHLCPGVGKYIASCSLFQTLIAPCYGVPMVGINYNVSVTPEEITDSHAIAVTDANRELCQLCAFYATIDMYSITTIE